VCASDGGVTVEEEVIVAEPAPTHVQSAAYPSAPPQVAESAPAYAQTTNYPSAPSQANQQEGEGEIGVV